MQMNFRFVCGAGAWKFKKKLRQELFGEIHRVHAIDVIAACGNCGRTAASRKMNKIISVRFRLYPLR
jgi:hypothetical protein